MSPGISLLVHADIRVVSVMRFVPTVISPTGWPLVTCPFCCSQPASVRRRWYFDGSLGVYLRSDLVLIRAPCGLNVDALLRPVKYRVSEKYGTLKKFASEEFDKNYINDKSFNGIKL